MRRISDDTDADISVTLTPQGVGAAVLARQGKQWFTRSKLVRITKLDLHLRDHTQVGGEG
jgi:hypothetical protein